MRIFALIFLLCVLTGCASAPDTYLSVSDHTATSAKTLPEGVTVSDYAGLKRAILQFVEAGQTEGTIWTANYKGDVESDLTQAAYEVTKLNPVGAYAVDYMAHDCTFIVNYYEISVSITFRRTAQELERIESVSTQAGLRTRVEQALENHENRVVLRTAGYRDWDVASMVEEYCAAHPDTIMEQPQVTVSVYPDTGTVRIIEIDLTTVNTASQLEDMEDAVWESIHAAAEYIRYRQTDWEKVELLFTYLLERFPYAPGDTVTPLYDSLCAGVANDEGVARAWQLISDTAGMECYTVEGLRNGEPYTWNIIRIENYYRHVDLQRCMLEYGALQPVDDGGMHEYYWNTENVPACDPYPEEAKPVAQQEQPAEEAPAEESRTEETPEP